jgi:uncharacterized protein DUF3644
MDEYPEDDVELAEWLRAEWDEGRGQGKSQLERLVWNDGASHGRRFDRYVRQVLGVETTRPSKQSDRIADLENQVRSLGGRPRGVTPKRWEEQLQHARAAALSALRTWNDPIASFRTGSFSLHLVTAWNSLAIAVLQKEGVEWRELTADGTPTEIGGLEKALGTSDLIADAFPGQVHHGLRSNIEFWVSLRNAVAHRHLPALDSIVIPHAQSALLNLEGQLSDEFGDEYQLADALSVPLQLSGFRDPGVLRSAKMLQRSLPIDVQAFLSEMAGGDEQLLHDPTFMLRIAFIPAVLPSGRSPDAVAYFARPGEVPEELAEALDQYVVIPKVVRPPRPNLIATQVVAQVQSRIPYRFNMPMHTEATYRLNVRSRPAHAGPEKVDERYCEYVSSVKRHLYNRDWVERLVGELSDAGAYESTTGRTPIIVDSGDASL